MRLGLGNWWLFLGSRDSGALVLKELQLSHVVGDLRKNDLLRKWVEKCLVSEEPVQ